MEVINKKKGISGPGIILYALIQFAGPDKKQESDVVHMFNIY